MKRPLSPAHVSPRNQTQEICKLLQILSLPMTGYEALMRSHNLSKFQFSSYKMGVSVDCWVIAGLAETLVLYGTKVPWLINVCGYRYFAGSPEDPARQELAVHTFCTVKTPWVMAPPTLGAFPYALPPAVLFRSLLQPQYISPRMCSCSHTQAFCLRVFILAALLISKWTSSCVLSLNNSTSVRPSPSIKSDNKIIITILSNRPILIFP